MEERLYIKKAKSNVYCYYTVLCLQCMGIFLGANLLINDKNVIKELDISALELISTLRTISKFLGGIVAAIVAGYGRRRLLLITGFMAVAAMAIGMFTTKWCLVIAIVTLGTLNRVVILPTLVFLKEIVAFSPIYGIIMFQALTNAGNLAGRLISAVFIAAEPYPILYEALYKSSIILFGAVPCIIQLVMFIWKFRYESVLYLIEKGKPLETQDFLKEITGDEALAVEKFEEAKRIIHKQKNFTVKLKDLLTRRIYIVPFLILGPIMFLKYFSFLMPYESFIDYVFPVPIVKGSYTNFLLNEIMDTLIPVGNLLAIYLVRKLSPRLIFTVGLALSAVLSLIVYFLMLMYSFGGGSTLGLLIVVSALNIFVQNAAVNPLEHVYVVTNLPDKALGFSFSMFWFGETCFKYISKWFLSKKYPLLFVEQLAVVLCKYVLNILIVFPFVGRNMKDPWGVSK